MSFNLRQFSTTERIAATFGPGCGLPMCNQFFRLCRDLHYAQFPIMRSTEGVYLGREGTVKRPLAIFGYVNCSTIIDDLLTWGF